MRDWRGELRQRLSGLRLEPAREAEIVEELSVHLEDRHRELTAEGASEDEAHRLALAELRDDQLTLGLGRLRQAHAPESTALGTPASSFFGDLGQDLRYGLRMLGRQPGFALAAIATLALGIGANTAIFSLVNAMLLQRLPVADSGRLVYVFNGSPGNVFSYPEYAEHRDGNSVFDGFSAWGGIQVSLNAEGETDLAGGLIVTGNFFEVLGVRAALGRVLAPSDDVTPGAHPVVVLSDGLWRRRFGGRPDVVGRQILMNGGSFTIVGVLPREFAGPQLGTVRDLYVPMMMQAVMRPPRAGYSGEMNPDLLQTRGNRWLFAVGRMKPGVTRRQVEASLGTTATAIDRTARPESPAHVITAFAVDDGMPGERERMLPVATLLLSVSGAVLLIGCANVANLLLSRASARRREIAVRLAIGASRPRLVRQLLTESMLLATLGGAAGVALAWLLVGAFQTAPPPAGALPIVLDFTIDRRVLAFSFAVSFATGILFGLAPALRASRPDLVPALKDESFVPNERARRFGLKKALIVGEVAVSLILLVAAALFLQSLRRAHAIETGFDTARLVSAPLGVNLLRYTRAQGREFYAQIVERVQAIPGVESASVARIAVLSGGGSVRGLQIEGREASAAPVRSDGGGASSARSLDSTSANVVGPGYFRTMGIGRSRGRDFGPADVETGPPVVLVNRAFADLHFPKEEVLGKRISVSGPQGPWREIVGVVNDSKYLTLREDRTAIVYLPLSQNHETGMMLHVRTSVEPATLVAALRREIQVLEPNLPVPSIRTMSETVAASLYAPRMGALLLSVFGGLALLLAGIGVYGVLAFSVSHRSRELGLRIALGASRRDVFGLVLREGMLLVAAGVAIGLVLAALGARALAGFLYGVSTSDAATFLGVPLVLASVALVACYVPARRAMRADPLVALRSL